MIIDFKLTASSSTAFQRIVRDYYVSIVVQTIVCDYVHLFYRPNAVVSMELGSSQPERRSQGQYKLGNQCSNIVRGSCVKRGSNQRLRGALKFYGSYLWNNARKVILTMMSTFKVTVSATSGLLWHSCYFLYVWHVCRAVNCEIQFISAHSAVNMPEKQQGNLLLFTISAVGS